MRLPAVVLCGLEQMDLCGLTCDRRQKFPLLGLRDRDVFGYGQEFECPLNAESPPELLE